LLSLLTSIESTTKSQSKLTQAIQPSKNFDYQKFENKIRERLSEFSKDMDCNKIELEPADKNLRTLTHEVVSEYPDLVSSSIGDFEERHVVVYRKGHENEGISTDHSMIGVAVSDQKTRRATHSKTSSAGGSSVVHDEQLLTAVHQVKRDRRSMEEIQEDISRRKKTQS